MKEECKKCDYYDHGFCDRSFRTVENTKHSKVHCDWDLKGFQNHSNRELIVGIVLVAAALILIGVLINA